MNKLTINPILKKELTLGSRSIRFPLSVMIYGGVLSLIAVAIVAGTGALSSVNYYGYNMYYSVVDYSTLTSSFLVLVNIQLAMICMIIPVITASSIAGERERQTLDVMLVTPISPFSLVAGKLLAALSNVFIFIISSLPALSLCFLYGGIKWHYLLIFVMSMMVMAFFIGAVGIWCSSVFKKTIASVIITMIIEGIFFAGPVIAVVIYEGVHYAFIYNATGRYPDSINIGWFPVLLLIDPILGFIDGMIASTSGAHVMSMVLDLFSSSGGVKTPAGFDLLADHWSWFSYVITILLGLFFMWLAAREVDSTRRKGKKMKKKSKGKVA